MANLKEVKARITSVTSTQQITKAMKMVAAAKLRKAQDKILQMRPYSKKLSGIIQNVSSTVDMESIENVYSENREPKNVLLVVVASDRGLCGAFNSNIFKHSLRVIEEKYNSQFNSGSVTILPIGKRSFEYYSKRNFNVIDEHWNQFHNLAFENVIDVADSVMKGFVEGKFDRVELIYNEFKNVATQILVNEQFLPIVESEPKQDKGVQDMDYIFEPNKEFIFKEIIPKSLKIQFYKALLESNAAEQGARMSAMDQATENAAELLKDLRLTYNRTRQAAITKEILEIVGGAEALAQGS